MNDHSVERIVVSELVVKQSCTLRRFRPAGARHGSRRKPGARSTEENEIRSNIAFAAGSDDAEAAVLGRRASRRSVMPSLASRRTTWCLANCRTGGSSARWHSPAGGSARSSTRWPLEADIPNPTSPEFVSPPSFLVNFSEDEFCSDQIGKSRDPSAALGLERRVEADTR